MGQGHPPLLRLAAAVLLGAVLAGSASTAAGGGPDPADAHDTEEPAGPAVVLSNVSRDDHPATYTASVDYPQVEGLPDPAAEQAINQELERVVGVALDAFTKRPHQRVGDHEVDSLEGRFETVRFDETVAAFRLAFTERPAGTAHEQTSVVTVNFDRRTGRRYALADLFVREAAYLERLSDLSRRALAAELDDPDRDWIEDGTRPRPENFAGWSLAGGDVEITFAEYQVAPYADGRPRVTIPFGSLADIADPGGPLTVG